MGWTLGYEEDREEAQDQVRMHIVYLLLTVDMMWPAA